MTAAPALRLGGRGGSIPRDSGSHGGGTVTGSSLTRGSCSFNKLVTCSGISRDPDSGGTGSRAPDSGQLPLQFQVQQVCDLQRQQQQLQQQHQQQ